MQEDSYYSKFKDKDEIDLGRILRFLLMQSKLIIFITVFGFAISFMNFSLSTKQYQIDSLLQYESINQNILDPSVSIGASSGSSTDITNLITLYESRTNILKLIKDLNLNIDVKDLSDNESIDINIESITKNKFIKHNLNFSFNSSGYALVDIDENELAYSNYGEYLYFNDLKILINSSKISDNRVVEVVYRQPETMFNKIKRQIVISSSVSRNSYFRNEGLITVSLISEDPELGKNILNYANEIFLNQRISVETEKSRKAIEFINTNIKSLETAFENKKIKLNEFRERNQSIDVTLEIQGVIRKIEILDQSISSVDLAIAKAKDIYTENNSVFLNLINEKKIIEKQKEDVLSKIKLMPKEQQEYIDLYKDVEVSQALFEELESRRLGLSILEASTIGDIRVVDDAYFVAQVSPKMIYIILFTFVSFLFGCVLAVFRGFVFLPIANPAELFDNNIHIPIVGVIPKIDDTQNAYQNETIKPSIESLIVNIDSLNQNQNVDKNLITITSAGPGNGKSNTSVMLAEGYVNLGKKVLLIDGDYKRGKLGKKYKIKNIEKDVFNTIDKTNIENFLIHDGFYLIPRISNLINSFEFLYNSIYKEKFDFFKEHFDYIILDTAPILSVADTSVLVNRSDVNILVIRHAQNRLNEIKQAIDQFTQINKSVDGVLYNAFEKPKSSYGYYGLYGNYSYKYYADKYLEEVYDYKKED